MTPEPAPTPKRPRIPVIDIARGVAIIAMVVYHLCWDLSYFRFIPVDVGYDPGWVLFARTILGSFLFLVGVGLSLGHADGIRWRAFWRRWLFVLAGALVITVTTWFAFPDSFVYFGVLHAIALFSLLALPFIRAPLWLPAITAAVFIALPLLHADPLFNERAWSWLGFWVVPPPANDLVPVFPWFGVVLLAVVVTRIARTRGWLDRLARIQPKNRLAGILVWLGRWSLVIYLVHQPLLLGIIYPLSATLRPDLAMRELDFLRACQQTCLAGGTDADRCTTYCQCGLEGVETNDLWNAVATGLVTAEEQALLDAQNRQCSILIYPELQSGD
ncbi:heparan-alpha-glucosaminide N-acetyltransferase [Devosia albogilva]|uniref:Heparan-alpha-glucosaminide N-acetyltransferase n=1 Tax=Devosia albogilva TaxID=429726 RepID=A0ABW5QM51_9HYPH